MGKSLIKSASIVLGVLLAGILYTSWGSFEYNVPSEQPVYFNQDGSLKR